MSKKILGLDLGTNSIGWALVEQDFDKKEGKINGLGSRIIPMSQDILGKFDSGVSISQTSDRTASRGVRRLYQRDIQRRERLHRVLNVLGFLPKHYSLQIDFDRYLGQFKELKEPQLNYHPVWNETKQKNEYEFIFKDSFSEMVAELRKHHPQLFRQKSNGEETKVPYDWTIYYLRHKALNQPISKQELAWIILNFNQKRGYYQLRGEEEEENAEEKEKTFETLKVTNLVDSGDAIKGSGDKLFDIYFENGWKYDKQTTKPGDWLNKTKEFIVTTSLSRSGETKRTFKAVDSEVDWIAIKKKTEQDINHSGKHIGTYIYETLLAKPDQKIRGRLIKTIERAYYKKELKQILLEQTKYHPELASEELFKACCKELYPKNDAHRSNLKDKDLSHLIIEDIIFYQRPLKSKKSTISNCQYETRFYLSAGAKREVPIKAAPKSHPLYQEFRLWQFIQNLRIKKQSGIVNGKLTLDIDITDSILSTEADWVALFDHLSSRKEVEQKNVIDFFVKEKKIEKSEKENYRWNYVEDKKYPAAETRSSIISRLSKTEGINDPKSFLTEDLLNHLWHIIYSVKDKNQYEQALKSYAVKYNLHESSFFDAFAKFPPFKSDYGAYSVKALNKILPLMRMGNYWNEVNIHPQTLDRIDKLLSGEFDERIRNRVREKTIALNTISDFRGLPVWLVGYIVYDRHSEAKALSKWETPSDIDQYLAEFRQHSLRNPIVEQVVTETLRVVRDIWKYYGDGAKDFFSEIHLELGREMKNPADKRKQMTQRMTENENTNARIRLLLSELMNEGVDARPYSPSHQEILKIYEEGVFDNPIPQYKGIDFTEIEKIRRNSSPSSIDITKYKLWLEQGYISPYTGATIPLAQLFTKDYQIEHIIPQSRLFDDSLSNKIICESAVNAEKDNETAFAFIKNNGGRIIELGQSKTVKVYSLEKYQEHCKRYFAKNRSKLTKLLSEEIPEGFIERQLNDTRYISKFIKGLLSNIVKEEDEQDAISKNIVPVSGAITDTLKNDWGLNDKWNEIVASRFERLNQLTNSQDFGYWDSKINAFRCQVPAELLKGFSKKRIDHRHHAMDALVIACATKDHVNYITSLNSERKNYALVGKLREQQKVVIKGKERTVPKEFKKPWTGFLPQAKDALETTVVSFKQNLRVINKTNNKTWQWVEERDHMKKKLVSQTKGDNWAIRKPLHKDTVSGLVRLKRVKKTPVSLASALDSPDLIAEREIRNIVKSAFKIFNNNPAAVKKHFKEHPIKWNDEEVTKVQVYEYFEATATRTQLNESFTRKQLESITDTGIQQILEKHLLNYQDENGKERFDLAFGVDGLDALNNNLIHLNNGKGHAPIRKVRIYEEGSKFSVGTEGAKKDKYVEAAKGTNLFFAIYWDEEKKKRTYETIPLNEVIAHQKWRATLPKAEQIKLPMIPIKIEMGTFLFSLSPNDLVYLTEQDQYADIEVLNHSGIYKTVSFSGSQCFFVRHDVATGIVNKVEFSALNKMEKSIGGVMIKDKCIKLKVDRIGNVKKAI